MERSGREEGLFSSALALPVAERTRYLERACAEDRELLDRLQQLLSAAEAASSFVKERSPDTSFERPGDWCDRYRLIDELGEGGCAVVYLAEQTEPVRRHVALKRLKPGTDDAAAVIARFETERQALAALDHPHIAKVFDAGIAPTGLPYFVMELVRGVRLTDYCNHGRLTVPERLLLFTQVCSAIQHAHHNGVIHRDIKPSNILVTSHDGVPIVKVIDFGLATAIQEQRVNEPAFDAVEPFVGTPEYMSPEQLLRGQTAADTRSDIYSLGVLLYELLTGVTPFDPLEQLHTRLAWTHRIRAEKPTRPSKRLEGLGDALFIAAPSRYGTSARRLLWQVRGDLDCIVMRCLDDDTEGRYQTPNDLKLDIERHLRQETVLARPPNAARAVRQFARRHKVLFAACLAALAFITFLAGFAVTAAKQAQRITAERGRAERAEQHARQVSGVIREVLAAADPFESSTQPIAGSEVLDQAARTITREMDWNDQGRTELLESVGRAYWRRGEAGKAVSLLSDVLETQEPIAGGDRSARIRVMVELGIAQRMRGDLPGSQQTFARAHELVRQRGLESSLVNARLLVNRARNSIQANDLQRAAEDLRTSLRLSREHAGPNSKEVADVLLTQSRLFQWTDDFAEAERTARQALGILEATVAPLYPDRVLAETRLAEVLYFRHRVHAAETLFVESLRKNTLLFGANSWQVADVLDSLAKVRRSQGRLDEAVVFARRAIAAQSVSSGEGHPDTTYLRTSLAALLIDQGKNAQAEQELRRALVHARGAVHSTNEQYLASAEYLLGEVFLATNRLREAEEVLADSVARWRHSGAPSWRAARSASALGEALFRQGRIRNAEAMLLESNRVLSDAPGADVDARIRASRRVSLLLRPSGHAPRIG